ncbi:TetR/AcrR family transcriptional regulator [Blastococcus sp. TF02A-30]|uniref:TetR/AcrR family transcriptional regulator n=1 Tax=Blastococcus sp. TF02A-30 TaxID=2250580 RepID=UPI000DEB5CCF|nr:helix-turn-helix domain-containing protein [Blastococcus sp. TF02A-30]RBY87785.1 TetR/AcrR family transcriptional regulator [Blastococcus sp. TF02A-30]
MARPFRQHADEVILDRAAALFARQGFAKTSVQDVADAVGLSKAGLLHHYPSKDALHRSVLEQAQALGGRALDSVGQLPEGPARDRRALELLVDVALAHPGLVSLLLAPLTEGTQDCGIPEVDSAGAAALRAFGVDPDAPPSERSIRVLGALAALAVLTLAAHQHDDTTGWRRSIVATCFDALGHRRPGAALPDLDQVEA